MIIVKLQGGLGNQLFQWAVGKSLSIDYNTKVLFETTYFNNSISYNVSKWDMDISKIVKIFTLKEQNTFKIITDNFIHKQISDNSFLDGYWQSEKYFIKNELEIRKDLNPKPEQIEYLYNKYPFLKEDNTISLHIRRGDYLNLSDTHPILPKEYYDKAIELIGNINSKIIIFSNDIQWCKENLKYTNTYYIENEDNISDLYAMSLCKDNIIANSTFSWWGAWLNININKKVIAPINWFGPKTNLSVDDIIPNTWIKI